MRACIILMDPAIIPHLIHSMMNQIHPIYLHHFQTFKHSKISTTFKRLKFPEISSTSYNHKHQSHLYAIYQSKTKHFKTTNIKVIYMQYINGTRQKCIHWFALSSLFTNGQFLHYSQTKPNKVHIFWTNEIKQVSQKYLFCILGFFSKWYHIAMCTQHISLIVFFILFIVLLFYFIYFSQCHFRHFCLFVFFIRTLLDIFLSPSFFLCQETQFFCYFWHCFIFNMLRLHVYSAQLHQIQQSKHFNPIYTIFFLFHCNLIM